MNIKEKILSFLQNNYTGAENAIQCHLLSSLCNTDDEDIRSSIEILRSDGHPICHSNQGYYYANKLADIDAAIDEAALRIWQLACAQTGLCTARVKYAELESRRGLT